MNASRRALALAGFTVLWTAAVFAGGPLIVTSPGRAAVWPDGGRNITYQTDLGPLGAWTNERAVAETALSFGRWESVPTATVSFVNAGSLPFDVDSTNFEDVFFSSPPGVHPIIYDSDGKIMEALFGASNGAFLVGGLCLVGADAATGTIVYGAIVVSGNYASDQLAAGLTHEIGHLVGLDHSKVNGDIATEWPGDFTGPEPYDTFARPASFDGLIEAMYPMIIPGVTGYDHDIPKRDDVAIVSTLYPEPSFSATTGSIRGRIFTIDGTTPLNGVNVVARNLADPFVDAVTAISGAFAGRNADPLTGVSGVNARSPAAPADALAGAYELNGLTPGAQYAVFADGIFWFFASWYNVATVLPGPEEFYNGPNESNSSTTDPPGEYTAITPVAGSPATGVDIVFNALAPGPIPIETFSGRTYVPLLLPFPVDIAGRTYRIAYLNAFEGSLTFGAPAPMADFPRKAPAFLSGPASVAALNFWVELHEGGTVAFEQTATTFTVHWTDVPALLLTEYGFGRPNTFSITLHAKALNRGNLATITYGAMDVPAALAGFTSGPDAATGFEPESDLSSMNRPILATGRAAVYEEFLGYGFDMAGRSITFELPATFNDAFEPNNSLGGARVVQLPFNTARDYAGIAPGDVDFYRFRAKAGDILLAETVPGGPVDTLIGLFGPSGTLLAANDNVRSGTPFSRLIVGIPADGDYALAVTTPPDSGFTGAGAGGGRYVLTLNAYRGRMLPLIGDDLTAEVPLRFSFPFQGQSWQSIWVSSNGNLTFGAPEMPSVIADMQLPGFLAGPPRIAPFFTDLDPKGTYTGRVGGIVLADDEKDDSISIHWISVPMLLDRTTNTFSVTLTAAGDVKIDYGAITARDRDSRGTIVGVSAGNGVTDPGPTDLSNTPGLSATGTNYERFAQSSIYVDRDVQPALDIPSFDLSFGEVKFTPP